KSLGTVDSGLGPMAFSAEEEPRPVAVSAGPGGISLAYYTGHQSDLPTTTVSGQPYCSLVLSHFQGGTSWTHQAIATGTGCDAAPSGAGTQSGRYVSMARTPGGIPVIAYFKQISSTLSEPRFIPCTDTACSAVGTDVSAFGLPLQPNSRYGR